MKRHILRLSLPELLEQRERVRWRDGYRCRCCRRHRPLQVHHLIKRSQGGSDEMENLISLCVRCHDQIHRERKLRWTMMGKVLAKTDG